MTSYLSFDHTTTIRTKAAASPLLEKEFQEISKKKKIATSTFEGSWSSLGEGQRKMYAIHTYTGVYG